MKQIPVVNEPLKSNVKWKESLNRTASFNKFGSSSSLVNETKLANTLNLKSKEKIPVSSKSKEKSSSKPSTNMRQSKSPPFDKLYERAKDFKSKIEDKRNQIMDNLKKKSIPSILKASREIERDPNLFSERLYPYHKLAKVEGEEAEPENEYEFVHVATVRSNPLGISGEYEHEEYKNNLDNIFHDVEEIRTLYGNKPEFVKFYRGIKSKKIQKYPFKPDIQIKRGSNSLEHTMKKSEERKVNNSFQSNSPCKKINEFSCESNRKSNCNNKEIELTGNYLKSSNKKDKINEIKVNQEYINNVSSNLLPKNPSHSAESSNLRKSIDKSNKKVMFALGVENNDFKKLGNDGVKKDINGTKSIEKSDLNIKNKIEANRIKPENNISNGKKVKEDPMKISEKLYTKGVNLLKKKEKMAIEKTLAENEELAKLTFMPNVSKKQTKNQVLSKNNEECENKSFTKNNSFTSGLSKSFDNMIAVKKQNKNTKDNKEIIKKTSKSKSPFASNNFNKSIKSSNRSPSPNNNIEIINNINNRIKNSNQWQFPNKHAKKIFDSAYVALVNNYNSEIVNKIIKDSPNEYSTNSSNNHSTFNRNHSSHNDNKSINNKESELNSTKLTKDRPSVVSKLGENYHTVIDKRPMNNSGIYDRCRRWKENSNKNKNKMRENFEQERNKQCNFSPFLKKRIDKDFDDRFVRCESKHLDSYIKRRRNSLEHLEEQKNFEKKIFGKSLDKFSKKSTQPEEFNLSHSISRKSKELRNSAINLHKPEKVKEYRHEFKTGNFFNQPVVEYEENIHNKSNMSLNKHTNNSIIDFYVKNRNSLNKSTKAPSNNFLEKNRKILNENLKLNKFEKKFPNTVQNNPKKKTDVNRETKTILEDNNEYIRNYQGGQFARRQSDDNDNNVNTNPADEYYDNVEKNIEEKLLHKDMNVNLNHQLKLK